MFTIEEYNASFSTDENMKSFFNKTEPSDYYFNVNDFDGMAAIVVVAKVFWDTEKCIDDQTPRIEHLLPDDFYEACDSTWECERSVDEIRNDMIQRGFEEKLKLNHGDE